MEGQIVLLDVGTASTAGGALDMTSDFDDVGENEGS